MKRFKSAAGVRWWWAASIAALTAVAPLVVSPGSAQVEQFSEQLAVTAIEIPVRVLVDGQPVRGLTADDFVVSALGERQEIVGFSALDLSGRAAPRPAAEAVADRAPEGRSFFVLFDFLFASHKYRVRALAGARRMIEEQVHEHDRVAIATIGGTRGLSLVVGFTREPEVIEASLDVIEAMVEADREAMRRSQRRLAELRRLPAETVPSDRVRSLAAEIGLEAAVTVVGDPSLSGDPFASATLDGGIGGIDIPDGGLSPDEPSIDPVVAQLVPTSPEQIGETLAVGSTLSAIRFLTREMERVATWLRDVTGQKHMIYLSEGFGEGFLQDQKVSNDLQRMLEGLRRNGWTLHAIDIGGIPDPFSGRGFTAGDLYFMANETGGDLMENFNDIGQATDRIVERTSVIYVLTIQPRLPSDGRYHDLDVRLAERVAGARVLHRPGFYAPKPDRRRSGLERRLDAAGLLLGDEELEEIEARVVAFPLPGSGGLRTVPVVVEIDGESLWIDDPRSRLDLEIHAYALDGAGGVRDLFMQHARLRKRDVEPLLRSGGEVRFLGALAVPPGRTRVRVLVREGGRLGLVTTEIEVAPPAAGVTNPPLFLPGGESALVLRQEVPRGTPRPDEQLFLGTGLNVVPRVEPRVGPGDRLEFVVLVPDGGEGRLVGRLVDGRGEPVAGGEVLFVSRHPSPVGGASVVRGEVQTGTLEPGAYRLEVGDSVESAPAARFRVAG